MARALGIGIVGAGMGGLAAALALRRKGAGVTIFEKASALGEAGAGINLTPNAMKVVRALGIEDEVARISCKSDAHLLRSWKSRRILHRTPIRDSYESIFGAGYLVAQRSDLHEALRRPLPPSAIRLDARCTGVRVDGKSAVVALADGSEEAFDVVIGADLARTLHATKGQIFWRVRFPYALPYLFVGLKVGITLAVIGAVIGEFVGANEGLGFLIIVSTAPVNTSLAFASMAILTAASIVLYYIVDAVERLVVPWALLLLPLRGFRDICRKWPSGP